MGDVSLKFRNEQGGGSWELMTHDGWVKLPAETSAAIEAAKACGKRSCLLTDEHGRRARVFLEPYFESLETIGGTGATKGVRRLRRRELPPIFLPSEMATAPVEVRSQHRPGKARKLSVEENYARARIQITRAAIAAGAAQQRSGGGGGASPAIPVLSATELVAEAAAAEKKARQVRRKAYAERRLASAALSSAGTSSRGESSGGSETTAFEGEGEAAERAARFRLSHAPTGLPAKPNLGWVLGALGPLVLPMIFKQRKTARELRLDEEARLRALTEQMRIQVRLSPR